MLSLRAAARDRAGADNLAAGRASSPSVDLDRGAMVPRFGQVLLDALS
jgi:hypothetical protein